MIILFICCYFMLYMVNKVGKYHETAASAVLVDERGVNCVDKETDERVHIFMAQISQLQTGSFCLRPASKYWFR